MQSIVDEYVGQVGAKMDMVIGHTMQDLEARFSHVSGTGMPFSAKRNGTPGIAPSSLAPPPAEQIRTSETNIGNMITDTLRYYMRADVVVMNSGSIRADKVLPAGPLTVRDLLALMPMLDETVLIEITGAQLLNALENGVSQYPKFEGRFPQVAGVKFAFDPQQPPGSRVKQDSVQVLRFQGRGGGIGTDVRLSPGSLPARGEHALHACIHALLLPVLQAQDHWEPMDMEGKYKLATKAYLASGKDGYDVFKDCKVLIDAEAVSREGGPRAAALPLRELLTAASHDCRALPCQSPCATCSQCSR